MCLFSLRKVERELDHEVNSEPCVTLFLQYVAKVPVEVARRHRGWPDVRAYLRSAGLKSVDADPLFRPFVNGFRRDGTGPWTTIAYFLFWDTLKQIDGRLGPRDELGVVFSHACWSLLESIHRIDLAVRHDRIGQKIINDTWSAVRHECREKGIWVSVFRGDDTYDCPRKETTSHYLEMASAELAIDRSWAISRLRLLVRNGTISRPDYQILLGCFVYGRSLEDMAVHLGLPYETTKKRRQRVLRKIQKKSPDLSPTNPDSPLRGVVQQFRKEARNAR